MEGNQMNYQQNSTNINWYPRTYGKNQKANHRRFKVN